MNVARSFGNKEGATIQPSVGKSIPRKESWEKATGRTKYINDHAKPGLLHVKMAVSPHAHAKIISIDSSEVLQIPGVKAVITGILSRIRSSGTDVRHRKSDRFIGGSNRYGSFGISLLQCDRARRYVPDPNVTGSKQSGRSAHVHCQIENVNPLGRPSAA